MRSLNYDDIMGQFMSAMEFKHSIPELQEHCQLLIGVLERLGGVASMAADEIARVCSQLKQDSCFTSVSQSTDTRLSKYWNTVSMSLYSNFMVFRLRPYWDKSR